MGGHVNVIFINGHVELRFTCAVEIWWSEFFGNQVGGSNGWVGRGLGEDFLRKRGLAKGLVDTKWEKPYYRSFSAIWRPISGPGPYFDRGR
jgi:hypothetical protein